jgi:hypothetical protein
MKLVRLAYPGSLVGFDANQSKIWDGHVDNGTYIDDPDQAVEFANGLFDDDDDFGTTTSTRTTTTISNAIADKIANSTLELTEYGVRIYGPGPDGVDVVTWRIDAPGVVVAETNRPTSTRPTTIRPTTASPTAGIDPPTISPTTMATEMPASTTSSEPTIEPTPPPTILSMSPTITSGTIGGRAFLDTNGDGHRDADSSYEPYVPYVPVRLYTCYDFATDDDRVDDEPVIVAAARTNAQGLYRFKNLFMGHYRVVVRPTSEYGISPIWSGGGSVGYNGTDDGDLPDNDFDSDTSASACYELTSDEIDISLDIGMVLLNDGENITAVEGDSAPTSAPATTSTPVVNSSVTIFGIVFDDVDDSGYFDIVDDNETGFPNVRVALFDCDGSIKLTTRTDDNGMYGFSGLVVGSYLVRVSPPGGYRVSSVWTGLVYDADSMADPATNSTICQEYQAGDSELNVGMSSISEGSTPSLAPIAQPVLGDGSPCSGAICPIDGMCRNKAGLCGAGLSFCNQNSVWDPTCADEIDGDGVNAPISTPTTSLVPSLEDEDDAPDICNDDGTVGMTKNDTASDNGRVQGINLAFTYAIKRDTAGSPDSNLVAKFENELHMRLSCVYFIGKCLSCKDDLYNEVGSVRRRRSSYQIRFMVNVNNSSVAGISALPKDEPNTVEGNVVIAYRCCSLPKLF